MLDRFIHGLEPFIGHEVLKEEPQTFKEDSVYVDRISQLANLVSGGGIGSKWCETPNYAPMELVRMGTH